mgnify:CR=1 FL=1
MAKNYFDDISKALGDSAPNVTQKVGMSEIGMSGLVRQSGYVTEEFLHSLQGRKGMKTYREMSDNDAIVGAILFAVDQIIRSTKWDVEPFSPKREDVKNAKFVQECMDDMSTTWLDFISEIMSMLVYGFSLHEIVYKRRMGLDQKDSTKRSKFNDGRIGWRKMPIRSQDSIDHWIFDKNGGIRGCMQLAPPTYKQCVIPMEKCLLFRTHTHKNNPEGRSILRNAYRSWYFKKRIEEIEGVGLERDLAGIPIAYVDPAIMAAGATADQQAMLESIKKLIVNVRRDTQEGIVFPRVYDASGKPLYEFELLNSGGSRQFDTTGIITRYEQRIAMTVLADFILLGHGGTGSYSLAGNKTRLFAVALESYLDNITNVFNDYAIPKLFEINGMKNANLPKLRHSDLETPSLQELAQYISTLAGSGMQIFPDGKLEEYLRSIATLPKAEDGTYLKPQDPSNSTGLSNVDYQKIIALSQQQETIQQVKEVARDQVRQQFGSDKENKQPGTK